MAAVGLLYVGAVLFVNGLALLGFVRGTSMIPMNVFVGLLQVVTPLYLIFTANGNQGAIVGASGLFLFGFTYLYVAMNNAFNLDGSGLGWFCLFVAVAACVYSYWNFANLKRDQLLQGRRLHLGCPLGELGVPVALVLVRARSGQDVPYSIHRRGLCSSGDLHRAPPSPCFSQLP